MALSHAECRDMIDGCARAGVPLYVAYYAARSAAVLEGPNS